MNAHIGPIPAITADQMRQVDRLMVETYGIALLQMMELAGRTLAELVRDRLGGVVSGKFITVAAGRGNNGGGGLVAARHLGNWGATIAVLVDSVHSLLQVPRQHWETLARLSVDRHESASALAFLDQARADLIIDALIGYSLRGAPYGWSATMIERINVQGAPVVALDLPSGLNATTGEPSVPCVRAAATMTLALPKTGLLAPAARPYVGDLYLADIGVPPALYTHVHVDPGPIFTRSGLLRLDAQGCVISDGG